MNAAESASVVCSRAGPQDARDINALLRENPMDGAYSIALTREPDPFAAAFGAPRHVFIIARDNATGEAVGLCERVVRECFVDGSPRLSPYLGALRISRSHRGRIGVLRAGFALLRETAEQPDETSFALTSIAAGNDAAERLLTAGLRGLPVYRRIGGYSTFALRPRARRVDPRISPARDEDMPDLAAFLNDQNRRVQFAPVWNAGRLRALAGFGLPPARILVRRAAGEIVGSLAIWDQRAARQTRVLRYPALLGAFRPLANLAAPFIGLPSLPPPGAALSQATLSLAAARDDDPELFGALLDAALTVARAAGFAVAALGLASDHPWRATMQARTRSLEYRSTLYLVHWQDARIDALPSGRIAPELGFL